MTGTYYNLLAHANHVNIKIVKSENYDTIITNLEEIINNWFDSKLHITCNLQIFSKICNNHVNTGEFYLFELNVKPLLLRVYIYYDGSGYMTVSENFISSNKFIKDHKVLVRGFSFENQSIFYLAIYELVRYLVDNFNLTIPLERNKNNYDLMTEYYSKENIPTMFEGPIKDDDYIFEDKQDTCIKLTQLFFLVLFAQHFFLILFFYHLYFRFCFDNSLLNVWI